MFYTLVAGSDLERDKGSTFPWRKNSGGQNISNEIDFTFLINSFDEIISSHEITIVYYCNNYVIITLQLRIDYVIIVITFFFHIFHIPERHLSNQQQLDSAGRHL